MAKMFFKAEHKGRRFEFIMTKPDTKPEFRINNREVEVREFDEEVDKILALTPDPVPEPAISLGPNSKRK